MIDRKNGPEITTDFDLKLTGVDQCVLKNGIKLYEVNTGTQNIVKIELVFRTGRIHETKRASAKAAFSLLREGSTRHDSESLAESFDYYGAVSKTSCGMETSTASLVVVERYFDKVWPIWLHMIFYPLYDQQELDKYKQVASQKLLNAIAKNDVLCYRLFTEQLFGADHPYGYNTESCDITSLERTDLLSFYNKNVSTDNTLAVLCGKYSKETRALVVDTLQSINRISSTIAPAFDVKALSNKTIKAETTNDVQVAIKSGRLLFNRKHPHHNKMKFLGLVLGGYFGSRLMKNIREDKGYTYGIHASVHCWNDGGFIYISTDVANKYLDPTLAEIHKELARLQDQPIAIEELNMVKNYILGQSLNLLDGPFAKGDLIKELAAKNLTTVDFEQNVYDIKHMTIKDVQEMANIYLDKDQFTTVLTGSF